MPCDSLPPIQDVDITADYVERVAHHIQGAAGLGGSTAMQWHSYLLQFGTYSAHLRDAVAGLACRLANTVVEWVDIRALMANQLISLCKEAFLFLGRIADRLSVAWGRGYGNILGWLKARLGFAVIRLPIFV